MFELQTGEGPIKTALVTGSVRGIGRAVAERLASDGFQLVINGRDREQVSRTAEELQSSGIRAMPCAADVANRAAVDLLMEDVQEKFGGIDVLVNNAAVRRYAPFLQIRSEDWQQVLDVGLTGAFNCSQVVLPSMMQRGWGRIINIAGVSGERGSVNRASLVTAKAGLIGLTKALALEMGSWGITVNAISPARIQSDRPADDPSHDHIPMVTTDVPVGRLGRLTDVAAACAFLSSEETGYITGQVLAINGGLYM